MNLDIPNGSPVPASEFTLLDAKQVAAMLNVSESWVRDHSTTKEPRLPAIKFGHGRTCVVRYHPEDIHAFIADQRKQSMTSSTRTAANRDN